MVASDTESTSMGLVTRIVRADMHSATPEIHVGHRPREPEGPVVDRVGKFPGGLHDAHEDVDNGLATQFTRVERLQHHGHVRLDPVDPQSTPWVNGFGIKSV